MAPPVGSLVVRIGSDIRGLVRGFGKGKGIVRDFGVAASRAAKRIALISTAAAAVGVAIGVKLTRDGLKAVDSLAKFSRMVGVSTKSLIGLQFAAQETAGFTGEQFNLAFQRMTRRLAEAAKGTGEARGAIKQLGLDAKALAAAGPDEAFLAIADAMQRVEGQGERLRIGFKLFDSEGARLVNTLAEGRAEIERLGRDAVALGLAFSAVDARQVEAANSALGRIGSVIEGVSRKLAVELSPFIQDIAERMTEAARESEGFGDSIKTGLEAGIKLSVLFARSMRLAAIAALSTAVAVEKIKSQTTEGNTGLTRFLARAKLVGDAAGTMELDRQFRQADKAAADAAAEVSVLEAALLSAVDSSGTIDKVEEALRGIQKEARGVAAALEFEFVGPQLPDDENERDDPETEALKEKLAKRLEIIRQGLLGEREAEQEAFAEKLARLQEAENLELELEGGFQAAREELAKQHQDRLTAITETAEAARKRVEEQAANARLATAFGAAQAVASIVENAARENFALQKAASVASTIISAIEAGIHSYRFGAQIGGPALGAAMAAVAVAANAAPLAAIRSADFKRGGSAPTAGAGAPTPALPPGQGGGGGGGAGAQSVNISLVGDTFGRTQVRDLIEEINDAVADGARLRVV